MSFLIVDRVNRLEGRLSISGAKNAALPIVMAALIGEGESILENIPNLRDINNLIKILNSLGAKTEYSNNRLKINTDTINRLDIPYDLARKMRASYYVLGALLARCGQAATSLPGGCEIGSRPIDLHLKGFKALGAKVNIEHGVVEVKADKLIGAKIYLDYPSVGATSNIMMAAVKAEGQTIIENAAREPEIIDLANYLNVMGAKIKGAGTDIIKIEGADKLEGREYTIIPDRIEAGTYMMAAAIIESDLYIDNVLVEHVKPLIAKLREMGVIVKEDVNSVRIISEGKLKAVDMKTLPYPGFPTDMQAQFMALLTQAEGASMVIETVFENRFGHVDELKRMGADIKIDGRSAIVKKSNLTGAKVKATDLRAGAALIIAGLVAEGETEIGDIYHIERGYENILGKLSSIGVNIRKVDC
ncbi:UDP-N-acetylglucosamine 1-carboxyvinyltransferase [Orenia metallireducens]|jgi:UDP-N-acetylglucosamine 1-carboxyvinyltransferase|uniref:UDP-N-acetylglucosamine 1-carboxyvinyltransferase n=1 Tax=Orenia metallireducens TaxID=1413210 RepID=A0A285GPC9_9FIRM|nr:UDP-N-acetylglucosamine 1-carboxyvinyltransferase [Orenia metallireducens]PRX35754.1 UDP-N-acetylglucosamine 1-carboxyvinyltransferase [Orenia metallireducens]SNY24191.1 UDP-N-acetylglucosamine 1-carboxyvinyltransferase [Orenia metallireducens]